MLRYHNTLAAESGLPVAPKRVVSRCRARKPRVDHAAWAVGRGGELPSGLGWRVGLRAPHGVPRSGRRFAASKMSETSHRITIRSFLAGAYLVLIVTLGVWSVLTMLEQPGEFNWGSFAVLLLMGCATTPLKFQMPGVDRSLSLSFLFTFAAITEQPAILALVIAVAVQAFDVVVGGRERESLGQTVFNVASAAISILGTWNIYHYLAHQVALQWALASAAAAATYYLLMSSTCSVRIAVEEQANPLKVWNEKFFWTSPIYMLAPVGVAVTRLLLDARSYVDTLIGLTVIGTGYFYLRTYFPRLHDQQDHIERMAEIRQRAIETLAVAIEAKDGATAGHLERVKLYATRLAERLGCSEQEIRTLQLAAVLHDVGKVGVPDYILKKPSRLTEHEFVEMSNHATIGAEIVSAMQFPEPVEQVVLAHHEHWDGSGYPCQQVGAEIPRLARILTIVDCFDALISERPYRTAMSINEAVSVMREQRGKIFDPEILDIFLQELPGYLEELARDLHHERSIKPPERKRGAKVKQTWITEDQENGVSLRRRTLQRLTEAPDQLVAFYDILRILGADLDFGRSLRQCLEILRRAIPYDKAGILSLEGDKYVLLAAEGIPEHCVTRLTLSAQDGLVAHAAHARVPLVADAPPSELPGGPVPRYLEDVRSTLAAPLIVDEQVVGVIIVCSSRPGAFDEEQGLFLSLITEKLALTLLSSQKLEQLQTDAQTDEVTQLPNARAAFHKLEEELNRAQREQRTVGVLFMDINGLKPVNDTFGHAAGDRLLIESGRKLRSCLRSYDFLGRVGGDEFLAILPGISSKSLHDTIRLLKEALTETQIEIAKGVSTKPRISIGASIYPDDSTDADDLVYLADQRMYRDKERDRNSGAPKEPASALAS